MTSKAHFFLRRDGTVDCTLDWPDKDEVAQDNVAQALASFVKWLSTNKCNSLCMQQISVAGAKKGTERSEFIATKSVQYINDTNIFEAAQKGESEDEPVVCPTRAFERNGH